MAKSFNPLHCGAVVSSSQGGIRCRGAAEFQSPSLRGSGLFERAGAIVACDDAFQSPSLRGSGLFEEKARKEAERAQREFQSPSLRGSGLFAAMWAPLPYGRGVSIPFIAGQWSLPSRFGPREGPPN